MTNEDKMTESGMQLDEFGVQLMDGAYLGYSVYVHRTYLGEFRLSVTRPVSHDVWPPPEGAEMRLHTVYLTDEEIDKLVEYRERYRPAPQK